MMIVLAQRKYARNYYIHNMAVNPSNANHVTKTPYP
jgi:hypothetical protein